MKIQACRQAVELQAANPTGGIYSAREKSNLPISTLTKA